MSVFFLKEKKRAFYHIFISILYSDFASEKWVFSSIVFTTFRHPILIVIPCEINWDLCSASFPHGVPRLGYFQNTENMECSLSGSQLLFSFHFEQYRGRRDSHVTHHDVVCFWKDENKVSSRQTDVSCFPLDCVRIITLRDTDVAKFFYIDKDEIINAY